MSRREDDASTIPETIVDRNNGYSYIRRRFFGKGGFAKCYELEKLGSGVIYAGKIVSKTLLLKENQKEKMAQEIHIHRSLEHKNIVKFYGYFEDTHNVYVLLELCRKRSMMELHKRRKALTEPEVRYFMKQLLEGVSYLHDLKIIHRDLKLGNLFLNDHLEVKIGDFGLAAKIEYSGQRKKTVCGTPNYIAPEILTKKGHSFEVDVWSIGCILYTLLVGRPPFETSSLRETYNRIKKCEFSIPTNISEHAAAMVHSMLMPDPHQRPTVKQLLRSDFMTTGYCPRDLPPSILTTAPRFDESVVKPNFGRKPFAELDNIRSLGQKDPRASIAAASSGPQLPSVTAQQCHNYLVQLQTQLYEVLRTNPKVLSLDYAEEMSDPNAQPVVWVSKWVDYSDKYGFGYQLCDDGVGVMFNDNTKLVLLPNQRNIHYIEKDGTERYYISGQTPPALEKKIKLLSYFRRYMTEHLMKAGDAFRMEEADNLSRMPYLQFWHRSTNGVIMQLTNGTVQINFSTDHTKIIMCPLMQAVTYIDVDRNFRTYRFGTIAQQGALSGLLENLKYAHRKITNFLEQPRTS
uniref:polo kinase n=3 Tax=Lygus hesperus TaxID=30085 RepID=A0A0K8SJ07_LYGHE